MRTWVYNTVQQARGERDWLKAFKDVDKFVEFERYRRRLLEEEGN